MRTWRLMARAGAAPLLLAFLAWLVLTRGTLRPPAGMTETPGRTVVMATWVFRPRTLAEAIQASSDIVLAQVVSIEPGEDLVVPAPNEPAGEDREPTQRIRVKVLERYKGSPRDEIVLFKTGNDSYYIEDDPPYKVGERTLLFLRKREAADDTYLPIAPDGRYRVEKGRLMAFTRESDLLGGQLHGRRLDDLVEMFKEHGLQRQISR